MASLHEMGNGRGLKTLTEERWKKHGEDVLKLTDTPSDVGAESQNPEATWKSLLGD